MIFLIPRTPSWSLNTFFSLQGVFQNESLNPTTVLIFLWPDDITCCFHYWLVLSFGFLAPLQLSWLGPQSLQKHSTSIISVSCKVYLNLWQGKGCRRTVSCDSQMKPAAYYFHICNFSCKASLWPPFDKESSLQLFLFTFYAIGIEIWAQM